MNKHQLLVFGLSAAVLFTACKKTDVAAPAKAVKKVKKTK